MVHPEIVSSSDERTATGATDRADDRLGSRIGSPSARELGFGAHLLVFGSMSDCSEKTLKLRKGGLAPFFTFNFIGTPW